MLNGFINLFKQQAMTSQSAVTAVKKILSTNGYPRTKIGHLGTLDPDGIGVLPLCLGKATSLFDYFLTKKKTYYTEFVFGKTSDTLDASSPVTMTEDVTVTDKDIMDVLPQMMGKISQMPPNYSAKSINGVRAYKLARSGQVIELKPSLVEIFSIKLLKKLDNNTFSFEIECSSGTYIRSICRDMAEKMGTIGLMRHICRTKSGNFSVDSAITLEELANSNIKDVIISIEDGIKDFFPVYNLAKELQTKVLNGVEIPIDMDDGSHIVCCDNQIIGIGYKNEDNRLKIKTRLI